MSTTTNSGEFWVGKMYISLVKQWGGFYANSHSDRDEPRSHRIDLELSFVVFSIKKLHGQINQKVGADNVIFFLLVISTGLM
jgi:hypothetical protein